MKKKMYFIWLIPLVLVGGCLFSCGVGKRKIKIGFSQCTGGEWREQMNQEVLSEAKFYENTEVCIKNASGDIRKQMQDIQSFIEDKVDLLIISPLEDSTLIDTFNNLNFHGIPVLLVDRKISSNKYISFVGASNWEVGVKAARYVRQLRGGIPTHILHIRGHDRSTATLEREAGFVNTLGADEAMRLSTIVSGEDSGGRNVKSTIQILQQNMLLLKSADVIYAFNDAVAIAAYDVLKKAGVQQAPIIIGVDGMLGYNKGINAVNDDVLTASIVYPTGGRKVIDVGMKIISRISVPKENLLPTILIDKNNVSAYYNQGLEVAELQQKIALLQVKKTVNDWWIYLLLVISVLALAVAVTLLMIQRRKMQATALTDENMTEKEEYETTLQQNDMLVILEQKVMSYVRSHYMDCDCDLSVLLDELPISRLSFYKLFKLKFRDTPNNYLKKFRLEKSKELILLNKYTYAEIGYQVGFSSPAYFTKCFKEEYNQTPSQYFEKKTKKNTPK